MAATNLTLYINELRETATFVSGTTYSLYGSDIKDSGDGSFTSPSVYVNGIIQLPAAYSIDKTNGTITFVVLPVGAVTCTYTWEFSSTDSYDTTVFELSEPTNIRTLVDVNGYRSVVQPTNKNQPWAGQIAWSWVDTDFFNIIRHIYDTTGTTFDMVDGALPADNPVKTLDNLRIVSNPAWRSIPGTPCVTNPLTIQVVQLES